MNRIVDTAQYTFEIVDRPGGGKMLVILDKMLDRPFAPIVLTEQDATDLASALVARTGESS